MSWLDIRTSLYKCNADNIGEVVTFRDILLTRFAVTHEWFYKDHSTKAWVNGKGNDLESQIKLRTLDPKSINYKVDKSIIKATLQCYTPSALLTTKKKDYVQEIFRTGIMQLDFDYDD